MRRSALVLAFCSLLVLGCGDDGQQGRTVTAPANAYGSKPEGQLQGGERTNGPNFNVRKVAKEDALFAIRNGGFSGAIMPANIVTGEEADAVATFLDKYSGSKSGG